jgi:hypothetical protein
MDATAWTATGDGASVSATATGAIDPGLAVITPNGMCAGSSLSQTFVMPPLSKAEPFKASVTFGIANPAPSVLVGIGLSGELNVDVGGRFFADLAGSPNTVHTASFCLGDKDYGRPIDFRIMTLGGPTACPSSLPGAFTIDQFIVQPVTSDECPMPGTVTNGDFEGTTGWSFSAAGGATAAIVGGVGESNSRAAQLATTTRCSEASLTGRLAVPAQIANPAIDLFYSYAYTGSFDARLTVSFDGRNISVLPAALSPGHRHICLPKWAVGTTGEVSFLLQNDANGPGLNDDACATPLIRTWTIDSVKLVSEATCGATSDDADGGFERIAVGTGATAGWGLTDGISGNHRGVIATIVSSPADAHTGNGVLKLSATSSCNNDAGADLSFLAPPPQGAAGPALKLFANVGPNNVNSSTVVRLGASLVSNRTVLVTTDVRLTIPAQGVYGQQIVCIPKKLSNRLITARIGIIPNLTDCTAVFAEERAFIDDVEITTDLSCTQ